MKFNKYLPSDKLTPFVKAYYSIETTEKELQFNHPQGGIDIVFLLRGKMIFYKENKQISCSNITFIPQQKSFFKIELSENTNIIGVTFFPEAFHHFFLLNSAEFLNCCLNLDGFSLELSELFYCVSETPQRFVELFETFLMKKLTQALHIDLRFTLFLETVNKNYRTISVKEMANILNVSVRTLERRFKEHMGISPKQHIKNLRLNHAIDHIQHLESKHFGTLVYSFGYYDQMHFIKDFKVFTGKTPKRYFRKTDELTLFFQSM